MKKFFFIVLPLCLLVALTVPAFAAVDVGTDALINSPIGKAGFVVVEDGVEYLQTIPVSTLPARERAVYDRFLALPDNRKMIVSFCGSNPYVTFVVPKADAKIMGSITDGFIISVDGFITFTPTNDHFVCSFVLDYASSLSLTTSVGSFHPSSSYLILGSDFAQDIINGTSPNPNTNFLKYYQSENRSFRDDLPLATHTLTVNYQHADGTKASDSHTSSFAAGTGYAVQSPVITGFTPDKPIVSGTMPDADWSVTVTYSQEILLYTLTVNYQYADGTKASDSHISEHVPTAPYSVASPVITGFTPDVEFVSGRMDEADLMLTVVYTKNPDSGGTGGGGTGGESGGGLPPWTGYNPFVKPDFEEWTGANPFVKPDSSGGTGGDSGNVYNPFAKPDFEEWTGANPFVKPHQEDSESDSEVNPFVKPEKAPLSRSEYPSWWFFKVI